MPSCRGLFTMPQKVSGKKVRKCKEWPGKFSEYLISQKSGRLPIIFCRHNNVVLAVYARLNFASKKPAAQHQEQHVKQPNCYASEQLGRESRIDSGRKMVSNQFVLEVSAKRMTRTSTDYGHAFLSRICWSLHVGR